MIYRYRVLHRLGQKYATPVRFLDLTTAKRHLDFKKKLYRQLGLTESAKGWYIESRTTGQWEEMK